MKKFKFHATAGRQALALLGAGVFAATPAFAQDTPETAPSSETQPSESQQPVVVGTEAQADSDDAIVVTGSRLSRPDLEGPSPVTTVSAEQFDLTGTVTVETLLNELPQLIPGNTRTSNNQGGEDFSTLDLRGLGPQRTLILVDGERVPATSTTGVVDIGTIPAGLIERVDVVTGGASAVYGSDAMAGVVNFVLKDNFEGLELTALYGISEHGDAGQFNVQGLLGGNFGDDRGNMTFFASYYTRDGVGQGDRDVTRNAGVVYYDYDDALYYVPDHLEAVIPGQTLLIGAGGSATPPFSFITDNPSNPFQNLGTLLPTQFGAGQTDTNCDGVPDAAAVNTGSLSFDVNGLLEPRNAAGLCTFADRSTGSSRYNFNPVNLLITPYNRLSMAVTGRYDINDSIRLKLLANYTDSSQEVNLAPTPAGGSTAITVPYNSPLIPSDLAIALASRPDPTAPFTIDRRFAETGPRVGITDIQTLSLRGTLSGPLAHGFNWDVTASYGRTGVVNSTARNINRTAVRNGLDGCPAGSLPNCVPIDIFGENTLTPEMINFLTVDTKETRDFQQARVSGNITGNLVELPAGPLGVAIGAEARTDRGSIIVDDAQRTGNIYGFNATQNQKGKINVKEFYGEIRVPILADKPFFHELSLEAGARYSDYSSVGSLFNYKFGAQWAPVDWVRLRGIYNKAARAPSIVELFQNGDQGFPAYTDFCADPAGAEVLDPTTLALCQAQVVQAGGPAGFNFTGFDEANQQTQAFSFGNPSLSEETAKTFTVGAVLTPNIGLGRFSATIDYYSIRIDDLVTTLGANFFLNACQFSGDPNSDACLRVARNPVTGQVDSVDTTVSNGGTLKTTGVDASINYAVPFADIGLGLPGRFRLQVLGSWLDTFVFNGIDTAGDSGGGIGGTTPEFKATTTVAYDTPSFTAQLRWNWQSDVDDISFSSNQQIIDDEATAAKIKGLSYFDLSLRKKIGSNFELTGVVQNMFNQKAKKTVSGYFLEGGVDTSYYSPVILGRTFTIAAKVKM